MLKIETIKEKNRLEKIVFFDDEVQDSFQDTYISWWDILVEKRNNGIVAPAVFVMFIDKNNEKAKKEASFYLDMLNTPDGFWCYNGNNYVSIEVLFKDEVENEN